MAYHDGDQVQVKWTADTILNFLYQKRNLLREMGVRQIGLFGSYVHAKQHPNSDIDLLFTMQNMSFTRWMNLWNFLEDQFGVDVDLVPEQDLRVELRDSVLPEVRYVKDL
jgi:predicted nucleotidyltransferase